jgi:ADP-ribose pyrophosphatase YjhB (NUDIX family)
MTEHKKRDFVGILVMTKIKFSEDSPEELVAILQRRGKVDAEDPSGFKWQSFPGLCEITSYGKAEEGESFDRAFEREMTEELGKEVTDIILKSEKSIIHKITEGDGDRVIIYVCFLPVNFLSKLKLEVSTGGLEIVRKKDLNKIKYFEFGTQKDLSSTDLNEIIITTLPIEKLKTAFEIFE